MKKIVCPRCRNKMKTRSRGTDVSTGKYVLRMTCTECSAVYSMVGKSHADLMHKLKPAQKKLLSAGAITKEQIGIPSRSFEG